MSGQSRRGQGPHSFARTANPELAAAMRELRRSSAASRHVPVPRKGTRRARREQAIRDHRYD